MRRGTQVWTDKSCRIRFEIPHCLGPQIPSEVAGGASGRKAEADIFGDSGAIRIHGSRTGGNAGPRAPVRERATPIQSSGAGEDTEERVMATIDEGGA